MYTSLPFQSAIALTGPHIACRVTFGSTVISYDNDLISCDLDLIAESFVGVFPSWKAKIQFVYTGTKSSYINQQCLIEIGAFSADQVTLTWIPMGYLTVTQNGQETDEIAKTITLTAYDKSATLFDKKFVQNIAFPITMKNFRLAYCAAVGIVLDTTEVLSLDDYVLNALNISEGQEITYREIARQDAQANLAMAIITRDGKLKMTCIFNKDPIDASLSNDDYSALKLENHYGPLNSIVLARQADGDNQSYDNVVMRNEVSIAENGLKELKLSNNIFLDFVREETITTLFPVIDGFIYTPFSMELFARPDIDPGDFVSLEDMSSNSYPVPITNMTISFNGGLMGTMKTAELMETLTNYAAAGPTQSIKNVSILVNKALNEIVMSAIDITTAQTQANTAVTNAATAQATADTAITNAATAQNAANAAQGTANTANTAASTANGLLADLASDSKLTAVEKQQVKIEWDAIVSEKVINDAQATAFAITTEKTNYGTSYSALSTYITPLLASLTTTSDIVGTTFRATFKDYYDKRQLLLNAIASKGKTLADAAQSTADTAILDVANIAIGGRNYLLNSEFKDNLTGWAAYQTAVISYNASGNLNINYPSITNQYPGVLQNTNKLSVIIGDVYTISAYIKRDNASIQPSLQVGSAWADVTDQSVVGVWCVVKATLIMNYDEVSPNVWLYSSNVGLTTGNLEVAWIKVEVGNKATDWTPAPEDVQGEIDTAQAKADTAFANAATANGLLADLASDNKLTAVEKQLVKKEWDGIVSEKLLNDTQATTFGITTEKTAYGTSYTALVIYIAPLLTDLTTTSDITGATFRTNFKDYYDKRTTLLNAIAGKAKTLADNAQTTANSKAKTFIETPTTPYYVGDNWIDTNAITGGNKVCTTQRLTGAYVAGDWTKEGVTSRVDSAELLITPTAIISTVTSSATYTTDLGGKEATIYKQTVAPATATNRLWLDTSVTPNVLKRWNGSAWVKVTPTVAGEVGAYTKGEVDNTFTSYSTITQTASDITLAVETKEDAFYKQASEPFTQLVTNGDFSNGTTGWTAAYSTAVVSNKVYSYTGNGASATLYSKSATLLDVVPHDRKFYGRVDFRVTNANCLQSRMIIAYGNTGGLSNGEVLLNAPVSNQWYSLSTVATALNTDTYFSYQNLMIYTHQTYANAATANGKTTEVKNVIVIDLTAIFGAGNEPTAAQMDLNIKRLWLDTLTNTYKSFDGGGWKPSSLLKGAKYVFDGTNATFTGGGLIIKNDALDTVFTADVDGNLDITGKITATDGKIGRLSIIDDDIYYQSDLFAKQYDNSDVTRLRQILAGIITGTSYDSYVYDINSSGALSTTDIIQMREVIAGTRANPNKMIRSIITIGKVTGEITVSSVSTTGYAGPSFTMQGDKISGKMANIDSASINNLTLNGLEVYSDAGTLKVR